MRIKRTTRHARVFQARTKHDVNAGIYKLQDLSLKWLMIIANATLPTNHQTALSMEDARKLLCSFSSLGSATAGTLSFSSDFTVGACLVAALGESRSFLRCPGPEVGEVAWALCLSVGTDALRGLRCFLRNR